MKWVDSMLSDGVNGTVSSKRVITLIAFVLCGIAFMVDLLTSYEAKPQLFD